jgi:hypothetical protein
MYPWPASPGPFYRWPGLEEPVGFDTNYNASYNTISYFDYVMLGPNFHGLLPEQQATCLLFSSWCAALSTPPLHASCYRVSGFSPKPSTSAILARSEIPWVIVITICVRLRGGAALVAPESLHQVLWRTWGRLHRLHYERMCGGLIPAFCLQGYVAEHQFTATTLLIDRSLGNLGLRRNNFFVICIEPQHVVPLRLLALWTLCLPTRFLEIRSLVDLQHVVLLLDLQFGSFEDGEQLRKGLRYPLHVVF